MNFPPTVDLTNAFPFTDENGEAWPGMSIRDVFAAAVLAGTYANTHYQDMKFAEVTNMAYAQADSMMAERNKTL